MRLVCPNCDAEYEVDASVIPDQGRDVQCSNCGHTWFQHSPEVEAEMAAEAELFDEAPGSQTKAPAPAIEPLRRTLDESVLAVLREEAEREAQARRAELPQRIETQTEMGLHTAARTATSGANPARMPDDPAATRIARMKGVEPSRGLVRPHTRRQLLPEIDEINSSLRASSERRSGQAAAVSATMEHLPVRRHGFRTGFVLMLLVAVALVVTYVMAPKITAQIPAAAPVMGAFVAVVDAARVTLDTVLRAAVSYLQGVIGARS